METSQAVPSQTDTLVVAKILVVDDEPAILEMIDRLLTKRGYRVETANSGEEAVEYIAHGHDYDVILLDMFMPRKEGKATYQEIAGLRPEFARRVIFITGNLSTRDAQAFLEGTVASYIPKPFNVDELTDAIQVVLGRQKP